MRFQWDEGKRRANIQRHGFDFTDAWEIFLGPVLTGPDTRYDYGEERSVGVGFLRNQVVVVVFSEPSPETTRIISLRKALSHERQRFEDFLRDRLG